MILKFNLLKMHWVPAPWYGYAADTRRMFLPTYITLPNSVIMSPTLGYGTLSDDARLTSV